VCKLPGWEGDISLRGKKKNCYISKKRRFHMKKFKKKGGKSTFVFKISNQSLPEEGTKWHSSKTRSRYPLTNRKPHAKKHHPRLAYGKKTKASVEGIKKEGKNPKSQGKKEASTRGKAKWPRLDFELGASKKK